MSNFRDYLNNAKESGAFYTDKPLDEFIRVINQYMHLDKWGFRVVQERFKYKYVHVTLQSDYCKVSFGCEEERDYGIWSIWIAYARLHAPEDSAYMIYEDKKCICWHNPLWNMLKFLDGMTPREATKYHHGGKKIEEILKDPKIVNLGKYDPEATLYIENEIWEQYNPELFQLFDLRDQTMWKKYYVFNKVYTRLENIHQSPGLDIPTRDMIC